MSSRTPPLYFCSLENGISEHANRLGLSQAIEHYENWFEFLVELYFCLGVFRSGVLL